VGSVRDEKEGYMRRGDRFGRSPRRIGLLLFTLGLLLAACGPADGNASAVTVASVVPTAAPPISAATATRGVSSVAQATTTRSGTASAAATNRPDGATSPVGCTPAEVEAFLERFLDAFNRGDAAALRTFFPTVATGQAGGDYSSEKFVWYSMTDNRLDGSKRHFVTFELPTLWAYFAERHAHQERLRLATLRVGRQEATVANLQVCWPFTPSRAKSWHLCFPSARKSCRMK
jgi:hypothetical protein